MCNVNFSNTCLIIIRKLDITQLFSLFFPPSFRKLNETGVCYLVFPGELAEGTSAVIKLQHLKDIMGLLWLVLSGDWTEDQSLCTCAEEPPATLCYHLLLFLSAEDKKGKDQKHPCICCRQRSNNSLPKYCQWGEQWALAAHTHSSILLVQSHWSWLAK